MSDKPNVIVIATRNAGKVKEFAALFKERQLEVRSLLDYATIPSVEEDGLTFAANALKKAKTLALLLGVPVLADDSGLCVDALAGAPGVWSARYAGEHATDAENNAKLVFELKGLGGVEIGERNEAVGDAASAAYKAQFICALALYNPLNHEVIEVEEACEGSIILQARGAAGFGYDPLFYLSALELTMAELTAEQKNQVSHRAKALKVLLERMDGQ